MRTGLQRHAGVWTSPVFSSAAAIVLIFFLGCIRDNPLDSHGDKFIPGAAPRAGFNRDTITTFIRDSVKIPLFCRDSAAVGGKKPDVVKLYFNWKNDSTLFTDSAAVPSGDTLLRQFDSAGNVSAYIRAKDNDGEFSPAAAMRLIVRLAAPVIDSVSLSLPFDSLAYTTDSVAIAAFAHDTNGEVKAYSWKVNANGGTAVTQVNTCRFNFPVAGRQVVYVKARDDDSVWSAIDSTVITVRQPPRMTDSLPPAVSFRFPTSNDVVSSPGVLVQVAASDPSGVYKVLINYRNASLLGATDTTSIWLDSLTLKPGSNIITAQVFDNSVRRNMAEKSIVVIYDKNASDTAPPTIELLYPPASRDTSTVATLRVMANVADPSGVAFVKCNNKGMKVLSGITYYADEMLGLGANVFVISVSDQKGNAGEDTISVVYTLQTGVDTMPPTVQIVYPRPNQVMLNGRDSVVVYAVDASGIGSVDVAGRAAAFANPDWVAQVSLAHGRNVIRVVATDSSALKNVKRDSVTVLLNHAPTFVDSVKDTTLIAGTASSIALCAADADTDKLSFAFIGPPPPSSTPVQLAGDNGCAVISNITPRDSGLVVFSLSAKDSFGGTDTCAIRMFVTSAKSTKPFFTSDTAALPHTAVAGVLYAAQLAAFDPKGRKLVFSLVKPPTPSSAAIDTAGRVTWTPEMADTGQRVFRAVVTNQSAGDTIYWSVTAAMPDLPPILGHPNDTVIGELQSLQIRLSASDPNNDAFAFSFGSLFPPGARLDGTLFAWTPNSKDTGDFKAIIKVTEMNRPQALSDSVSVVIRVIDVTRPEFAAHRPVDTVRVGAAYRDSLSAADADSDPLLFHKLAGPPGLIVGPHGAVSWTPQVADLNTASKATVMVIDNGGLADTISWSFAVLSGFVPDWPRVFGGDMVQDTGFSVVQTSDSGYALCGTSGVPSVSRVAVLLKTDASGNMALQKTFGTKENQESAVCLQQTADNGFILCGTDSSVTGQRLLLIKTASNGDVQWTARLGSGNGQGTHEKGASVAQTADGGYIACGVSMSRGGPGAPATGTRLYLVKVDASGVKQWDKTFSASSPGMTGSGGAAGCCVLPTDGPAGDGGSIVCGEVTGTVGSGIFIVKTSPSGDTVWTRTIVKGIRSAGLSLAATADRGYLVGGFSVAGSGGAPNGVLLKVNALGDMLWSATIGDPGARTVVTAVRTTADGGCVAAGYTNGRAQGGIDAMLAQCAPDGRTTWTKTYGTAGDDAALGAALTADGGCIFTGYAAATISNTNIYLVKTDGQGNVVR